MYLLEDVVYERYKTRGLTERDGSRNRRKVSILVVLVALYPLKVQHLR
jgi:hypothetical protein